MMKYFFSILFFCCLFFSLQAQEQNQQETARSFMKTGDFDNAILVLNRALEGDPNNLDLQKDLILSYYYKRDYANALERVKAALDRDDADVVTYQLAGNVYKALEQPKDAEKLYKRALKKFPASGALYSEYGELLWASKDFSAIEQWEKGIQADPSFAGNYYNAALFYYYTKDKVWSLLYGEIFVNMESLTQRAVAMKKLLLDGYKQKLFASADLAKDVDKNAPEFTKAFLATMGKQTNLTAQGITTETLTMIRTRFILDWFASHASKYPFKLFDYQQQLLKEGLFEAYNQWLFGTVENLPGYDNWIKTHAEAHTNFTTFQKNRVFKIPAGQFYGK
jgi:tetratricopeptide (TPR) repeat protein